MYPLIKIFLVLFLSLYCSGLYAENAVDIFDQNRGQDKEEEPVKKQPTRQKKQVSRGNEFSLSGISKIGDKYMIYFDTIKGKRDKFSWVENQKSPPVKIYNDYEINKIIDRTLYLNITGGPPCVEDQKQGVSCDAQNKQMILQLVRKKPIVKPPSSKVKRGVRKKTATKTTKTPKKFPLTRSRNDG